MLKLPGVTLVIAETRAHELARRTLADLVSRVEFGDIIVYSNDPKRIDVPGATHIPVEDWRDKRAAGRFYYTEAATRIKTPHALLIEWDAGLNDPDMWTDDFLNYDFIGAPWPDQGDMNVGNGGFMLLSKRLIDFVFLNRQRFPIEIDTHFACRHRRALEAEGHFVWAPDTVAEKFAFEGWEGGKDPAWVNSISRPKSFGYHGLFNWRFILDQQEIIERAKLIAANSFMDRSGKIAMLVKAFPWITSEISLPSRLRHLNRRLYPPSRQGLKA